MWRDLPHEPAQGFSRRNQARPPAAFALALREKVKAELDGMEANRVLAPVTEPTE